MNRLLVIVALAALLPAGLAAQQPGRPGGGASGAQSAEMAARRAELEARVLHRFLAQTASELELTDDQAERLGELFAGNMERRREAARAAMEARRRLHAAVSAAGTPDAEFTRRLTELEMLRDREHRLWQEEQDALATLLTPRQKAIFITRWLRLQDNIRDVMARRGPPR